MFRDRVRKRYGVIAFGEPLLGFALSAFVAVLIIAARARWASPRPPHIVGTGRGASRGILIKSAQALERPSHRVSRSTRPERSPRRPQVSIHERRAGMGDESFESSRARSATEHPRAPASSSRDEGVGLTEPTAFEALPGKGIHATVQGHDVWIGSRISPARTDS